MSSPKPNRLHAGWICICGRPKALSGNALATIDEFEEIVERWQQQGTTLMVVCAPDGCGSGRLIQWSDLVPLEFQD